MLGLPNFMVMCTIDEFTNKQSSSHSRIVRVNEIETQRSFRGRDQKRLFNFT